MLKYLKYSASFRGIEIPSEEKNKPHITIGGIVYPSIRGREPDQVWIDEAATMDAETFEKLYMGDWRCDDTEIIDRCCCECGDPFDGTAMDDYCPDCYDKLPMEDIYGV